MSDRDELAAFIFDAAERTTAIVYSDEAVTIADAILAAGYRKDGGFMPGNSDRVPAGDTSGYMIPSLQHPAKRDRRRELCWCDHSKDQHDSRHGCLIDNISERGTIVPCRCAQFQETQR